MNAYQETLNELATRARSGDGAALAELREELECQMVPLVRQALRGRGGSPFHRQVQETASRLARYVVHQPPDHERLARRVAACLCESLCERLAGRPHACECMKETVPA
jgi:hypothetical protein